MSTLLASVEILQVINNLISTLVGFIEYFGYYIFIISVIFFFLWVIYQVGLFLHDIMENAI